jgi:3-oxoacyl-[acyl-carrier-protein] synthase II
MNDANRRVVVTGMGVVSPVGIGLEAFWESLRAGRGGIRRIEAFDPAGLPTTFAGEITDYEAKRYVAQRKSLKLMARDIQLAVGAAKMALDDAGLTDATFDRTRIGVEFGASMISSELDELAAPASVSHGPDGRFDFKLWGEQALPLMPPLWMLKYLPNMPACHISILHDFQGPNNSITEAEAASNIAIGEAFRIISRGAADIMVAGGCDSRIHPLQMVRLCLQGGVSRRNDDPATACRPFDADRDGMVPAEGSGVVVLEELSHARARGARIYAEVAGYGSACRARAGLENEPTGDGCALAIRTALKDARMSATEIGYYNAHGTGARDTDLAEANALRQALGPDAAGRLPVSAHKSNFGNAVSGCGAIEFVAGVLALQHGLIPPTLNYERPDPACAVQVVHGQPRELQHASFLTANFTRAGQAAALVVRRCREP